MAASTPVPDSPPTPPSDVIPKTVPFRQGAEWCPQRYTNVDKRKGTTSCCDTRAKGITTRWRKGYRCCAVGAFSGILRVRRASRILSRRCIASRWGTRITVAHNPSVSTVQIIVVAHRRTLTTLRRRRGTLLAQRGRPRSRLMLRLRRTGGTLWSQLVLRTRNVLRTRVQRM
jgi:hypothetical protein